MRPNLAPYFPYAGSSRALPQSHPPPHSGQPQFHLTAIEHTSTPPQINLATPVQQSQNWFIDSGASYHITADPHNLMEIVPTPTDTIMFLGNRQGLLVHLCGSAMFLSATNPPVPLLLKNLLHVPYINKNLVSVSKFASDNHVYFEFYLSLCFVKSQVDHPVLLTGYLGSDGLYQFPSLSLHFVSKSS